MPSLGPPSSSVQAVAAIQNVLGSDKICDGGRVKLTKFGPLGEHENCIRSSAGFMSACGVVESREDFPRVVHSLGIEDGDFRPTQLKLPRNIQRGRISDVIRFWFERGT